LFFIGACYQQPVAQTVQLTSTNLKVDIEPSTFRVDIAGDGKNKYVVSAPLSSEKLMSLSTILIM